MKQSHQTIKRIGSQVLWLLFLSVAAGVLLPVLLPSVSTASLILVYGALFLLLKSVARFHHRRKEFPQNQTLTAQPLSAPPNFPKISVLISAHNEEAVIGRTVKNLLQLNYPDYELMVIDDRSEDETAFLLASLQAENENRFRFYSRQPDAKGGKAAALNGALGKVSGEILCFLDADAVVEPDFLTKLAPYFTSDAIGAVQSRKTLLNARQNWLTICQHYEYLLDAYTQSRRDKVHGAVELRGNGMLIRRKVLEDLAGWNDLSLTEDLDLTTRMHAAGWDIRYVPDVEVKEEGLTELLPLFRQRLRWTHGSLLRYLDHAKQILPNPKVAFRTRLDMLQFIFEFIAPVWLLSENLFVMLKGGFALPVKMSALFSATALLILSVYFLWATYQGAFKFDKANFFQSIKGSLVTYPYLSFMWLPLVFTILFRVVITPGKTIAWDKTPHYGMVGEP